MPDPKAAPADKRTNELVAAVNSGSAQVAVLHLAFIALCAYVLVIIFGTSDLDLLLGKSVKLPLVDVDVPMLGFYGVASYIVVVTHVYLLLHLQLLSRQVVALKTFSGAKEENWRNQLYLFLFTHYLVGNPLSIVRAFTAMAVTSTILILPLITLLVAEVRFLSLQYL